MLPAQTSAQRLINLLNKLGRRRWNLRVGERYPHGEGVVRYLARYVRGGPLKSQQILSTQNNAIGFAYRPHTEQGACAPTLTMHLSPQDFFERYLTHAPMPGQHQVRRYGLYAPVQAKALASARDRVLAHYSADAQPAPKMPAPALTWQAYLARFAHAHCAHRCPVCGKPIVFLGRLAHAPP